MIEVRPFNQLGGADHGVGVEAHAHPVAGQRVAQCDESHSGWPELLPQQERKPERDELTEV